MCTEERDLHIILNMREAERVYRLSTAAAAAAAAAAATISTSTTYTTSRWYQVVLYG